MHRACGISRSPKSVFTAWKKLVTEVKEQESKSRERYRKRILQMCLKALILHTQSCKEQKMMASWQELLLKSRVFPAWKSRCLVHARVKHTGQMFSKRISRSMLLRAVRGWARVTHQRFVNITIVHRLQRKWMQRVCTAVIRAWAVTTSSSRQRQKSWNRLHINIGYKLQRQCLYAWWKQAAVLQAARNVASFAYQKDATRTLQRCLLLWKHAITVGQQRQQRYLQASTARVMKLLAKVWEAWQLVWMQGKRHRRMIAGIHVQRKQRALSITFRAWLQFLALHKYQQMLLQGGCSMFKGALQYWLHPYYYALG